MLVYQWINHIRKIRIENSNKNIARISKLIKCSIILYSWFLFLLKEREIVEQSRVIIQTSTSELKADHLERSTETAAYNDPYLEQKEDILQ